MKRSPMNRGTSTLKRTAFKTPASSPGILRVAAVDRERKTKTAKKVGPRTTAAERAHLGLVAAMGCCLCQHLGLGTTLAEVHHVRARHGWGRSGHFATIPLCPTHHRGQPGGVHDMGRAQFAAHYGISEIQLLEAVTLQITNSKAPDDCESTDASIKYL